MSNFVWFNVWFTLSLNHLQAPFRNPLRCEVNIPQRKSYILAKASPYIIAAIHYEYETGHGDTLRWSILSLFLYIDFVMWHVDRCFLMCLTHLKNVLKEYTVQLKVGLNHFNIALYKASYRCKTGW